MSIQKSWAAKAGMHSEIRRHGSPPLTHGPVRLSASLEIEACLVNRRGHSSVLKDMTSEMTLTSPVTTETCPGCERPLEVPLDSAGGVSCPDCGYEKRANRGSWKGASIWLARRRKPLLATAAGMGVAGFAAGWPEQFSRWVLVLFALVVAILVLSGLLRLPNGSLQLAAILIVPALVMPLLWRYVSIGCFSTFVAVGLVTDSVKSRLKRSASSESSQSISDARSR